MTPDVLRMELLVRRLILLAGELRDALAVGDWEAAQPVQAEYDEAFAMFRSIVDGGALVQPKLMVDVERLAEVHAENERLMTDLRDTVGRERGKLRDLNRGLDGYAPLTKNEPGFAARFVDGSA